MLKVSLSQYRF